MTISTDQVLARRRLLLGSFLIGWGAWYGIIVLQATGLQNLLPPAANVAMGFVGMIGAILYTVSIMKIANIRKKYRDDPVALAALTDDLQSRNRDRALRFGFLMIIVVQVVLVLFGDMLAWSASAGAHVSILFGVAFSIFAAIWLDFKE